MGWLLLGSAGDKAGKVGGVAWGVSGVRRDFPGARGEASSTIDTPSPTLLHAFVLGPEFLPPFPSVKPIKSSKV